MAAGVYVGRRRPIWRIILFQILTLGVYGRVWLYRTAQELDGHDAFFLDRRLYLLGVLLPVGGPLVVKWRLVDLVHHVTRHDPTALPMHPRYLKASAFLPLLPVVHSLLQRHMKHHWTLHRKLNDLEARREVLESRRAAARTAEERAEVQRLDEDLRQRESVLAQAREAAVSIREAQRARARAEEEIRAAGGGPSRIERLRKLAMKPLQRRLEGRDQGSVQEPEGAVLPEALPPPSESSSKPMMGRRRTPTTDPAVTPTVEPELTPAGPALDESLMSSKERKLHSALLGARNKREGKEAADRSKREAKAAKAAQKQGAPLPPPEPIAPGTPSKAETKLQEKLDQARAKREAKAKAVPGASRFSFGRRKEAETPAEHDAIVVPPAEAPVERRSFFRRRPRAREPEPPAQVDAAPAPAEAMPPVAEPEPEGATKKRPAQRAKASSKRTSGR